MLLALVLRTVCQLVTWLATLEADQLLGAGQLLLCYPSLPLQTGVQLSLGQTLLLQLLYTHGLHNFNAERFQKCRYPIFSARKTKKTNYFLKHLKNTDQIIEGFL